MSGTHPSVLRARARAEAEPDNVQARIEAAYACDRFGTEAEAVTHYDAAWALGVPAGERRGFLVGYGSTLRNVGRASEAVAVLEAAVAEFPDFPPLKAFLALALLSKGRPNEALAAGLDALITAGPDATGGYERALAYYRDELVGEATSPS